jgi:hypothetical protein
MTSWRDGEHTDDVRIVRVISDVVTALGQAMQCARTLDEVGWRRALAHVDQTLRDARALIGDIRARSAPEGDNGQTVTGARMMRS